MAQDGSHTQFKQYRFGAIMYCMPSEGSPHLPYKYGKKS
jgi:hypothetical protein